MRRREFIGLLGSAALGWANALRAQQSGRVRRVGMLLGVSAIPYTIGVVDKFSDELKALGWIEDSNLRIDFRWSDNDAAKAQNFAKELVAMQPDLLIGHTDSSVAALRQESSTIHIVFITVSDPIGLGFVKSLSRPGGNATGFINFEPSFGGKWLEILKEIAPNIKRVGVIYNPATAPRAGLTYLPAVQTAAQNYQVEVVSANVRSESEIDAVLSDLGREPGGGLVVVLDNFITGRTSLMVSLLARYRLPAVHPYPYFPAGGGLMCYGVDPVDNFRKLPTYVDRVLRGESPQNLPVQLPTTFRLVINVKTAKALGLTVPPHCSPAPTR
jgi:putative ABC transport system substrate-binding protein